MPVVINSADPGAKKPDSSRTQNRSNPPARTGPLSDRTVQVALVVAVVALVVGLFGWSQGWFDGSAASAVSATAGTTPSHMAEKGVSAQTGGEEGNTIGHKRNTDVINFPTASTVPTATTASRRTRKGDE